MPIAEGAGVALHWEQITGAGGPAADNPPVVLVHDIASDAAGQDARARSLASHGRRVVVYDRRGYGASGAPEPYVGTTVAEQGLDLAALVRRLEPGPALLAGEGLLGHQHGNSGWGTFDDDNMVGATAFMETLELALELRRADYGSGGERLGLDLFPYTEDQVGAVARSVKQWNFIDGIAAKIDEPALRAAQHDKDAVRAYELVYAALGAEA